MEAGKAQWEGKARLVDEEESRRQWRQCRMHRGIYVWPLATLAALHVREAKRGEDCSGAKMADGGVVDSPAPGALGALGEAGGGGAGSRARADPRPWPDARLALALHAPRRAPPRCSREASVAAA